MINKIFNLIVKAGNFLSNKLNVRGDLILHFIASFIICTIFMIILPKSLSLIAPGITLLVGIGKEIYDKFKTQPTGFDVKDLFADFLGMASSYLILDFILLFF